MKRFLCRLFGHTRSDYRCVNGLYHAYCKRCGAEMHFHADDLWGW